jgi:hypothetical protein
MHSRPHASAGIHARSKQWQALGVDDAISHTVETGAQTPVQIGSAEQQRLQDLHHQSALHLRVFLRDNVYEVSGVLFDQVARAGPPLHLLSPPN